MFDNAGGKIEKYAEIAFGILAVFTIVMAMGGCFLVMSFFDRSDFFIIMLIAVLLDAAVLIFLEYCFCLMYAGFGQLVSNTAKSASDTGKLVSSTGQSSPDQGQTIIIDNSIISDELPDL